MASCKLQHIICELAINMLHLFMWRAICINFVAIKTVYKVESHDSQ